MLAIVIIAVLMGILFSAGLAVAELTRSNFFGFLAMSFVGGVYIFLAAADG